MPWKSSTSTFEPLTTNKHNTLKPQHMEILANIPAPIFGLGFGAILAALAFITSRKAA